MPQTGVVHCGTLLSFGGGGGVLHTVASKAQRVQLLPYYVLLYTKGAMMFVCGCLQPESFIQGLTSPPGGWSMQCSPKGTASILKELKKCSEKFVPPIRVVHPGTDLPSRGHTPRIVHTITIIVHYKSS